MEAEDVLVFFDGECRFCNRGVNFVLARDTAHRMRFAPLQGKTYAELKVRHPELKKLDAMVVCVRQGEHETVYIRSRAAFQVFKRLSGIWPVVAWLRILPAWFCDPFYRMFAALRYTLFGKNDSCRIPSPEERAVFLD